MDVPKDSIFEVGKGSRDGLIGNLSGDGAMF
jgi:hypothetical protein